MSFESVWPRAPSAARPGHNNIAVTGYSMSQREYAEEPFPLDGEGQGWGCALDIGAKSAKGLSSPTEPARHQRREHPHPNPSPIEGKGLLQPQLAAASTGSGRLFSLRWIRLFSALT
jgi:hypothetical protein